MSKNERPLLKGKTADELLTFIGEQLKAREPFYSQARYQLDISLMDNNQKVQDTVDALCQLISTSSTPSAN
jgi:shikimate kinase